MEPKFAASDLESQGGRFHTVTCLDVMIHYPQVLSACLMSLLCESQLHIAVLSAAALIPGHVFEASSRQNAAVQCHKVQPGKLAPCSGLHPLRRMPRDHGQWSRLLLHWQTPVSASAQSKADAMVTHLAGLAEKRLIVSFAPYTPYYAVLKRIGELFPGPSKVQHHF